MTHKHSKHTPTFLIVGLGLMGGSLARALRQKFPRSKILAVTRKRSTIQYAKKRRWIDAGFLDIREAAPSADFILIATPVDLICDFVRAADRFVRKGTIITDLGSTKADIIRRVERINLKRARFVGSHPMAGSHERGVKYAEDSLYKNALVFVTPTHRTDRRAVSQVIQFWKKLNTRVTVLTPDAHDKIVAEVSHLPHAIASILMHTVNPKMLRWSVSGFQDTTRIAQSAPSLWRPILLTNRKNIIQVLIRFRCQLDKCVRILQAASPRALSGFLEAASKRRRTI